MSGIYSTNKIKNLNQLNDVNITDLSNDEVIKYNSTSGLWENGTAGVENLSELNDVSITSEANNELLKYNSTSGKWENTDTIDVEEANVDRWLIRNLVPGVCAMGYDTIYNANQNSYAFAQQDDGATFINCKSGKTIYFVHGNNNTLMTMNNTVISLNRELEFKTGVELKTNGSYGTTGAVLTSRGTNNSPIWTEPYYFSATSDGANGGQFRITTADDTRLPLLHNASLGTGGAWTTTLETSGKNQFDETTAQWTCPQTGIYNITIRSRMNIDPFPDGNIGEVYLYLYKDTGSGFTIRMADSVRVDETESGTDPITNISLQITGLFSLNENDKVRREVMKNSDDTQELKCETGDYDPQFSIHKIA